MRQNFSFHVVGISHHTAAVPVRERFAISPPELAPVLDQLRQSGIPGVVLSTCNRCELYWSGPGDGEAWFRGLAGEGADLPAPSIRRHVSMAGVRHLFRVAAGLESQVLGEMEVLGQVRRAYDAARAAGTTNSLIDLVFSAALSAGRRVRRETLLGRHPASVSSAAVEIVLGGAGDRPVRNVILLGTGEVAEGILRAFNQRGTARVTVLSRHPQKAEVLARAWGADVGALEERTQQLELADVLVVATASARPVLTAAQLASAAAARAGRELVVVDMAVPRNVEPSSRNLQGVRLLDLDDLQRLCCPVTETASADLAPVEGVLEDELVRLGLTLRGRVAAPSLAELHRISREMAEQESDWALAQLEALTPPERDIVKQMADRLVKRVLYPVSRNLRAEG